MRISGISCANYYKNNAKNSFNGIATIKSSKERQVDLGYDQGSCTFREEVVVYNPCKDETPEEIAREMARIKEEGTYIDNSYDGYQSTRTVIRGKTLNTYKSQIIK